MSISLAPTRAAASRKNGTKSQGPVTREGKERSAQNALKHGLRAQKHVVLPGEDAAAFEAHEAALMAELAPEGALQTVLARRIVAATWRLERAEKIEGELFAEHHHGGGGLGLALIRDCNRARAFETLVRYRGGTLAEFWRALRTLKALQAERADRAPLAQACAAEQAAVPARPASVEPRPAANARAGRGCGTTKGTQRPQDRWRFSPQPGGAKRARACPRWVAAARQGGPGAGSAGQSSRQRRAPGRDRAGVAGERFPAIRWTVRQHGSARLTDVVENQERSVLARV